MTATAKKTALNVLYAVMLPAIVLAVWAIAAAVIDSQFILPDIPQTFVAMGELICAAEFWKGLLGTLVRALISFAISAALFFVLFFLASSFDGVRKVLSPLVSVLRSLPTMAIALVIAVWAGGPATPVILAVTVIMPQLYSATLARNATIPKELEEVGELCGANKAQMFFKLYLPNAAAGLPESLSSALAFDIKIVIAAEILMQTASSLGVLMMMAQMYLMTAKLIAMTVMAVVLAVALEYITKLALRMALSKYITA